MEISEIFKSIQGESTLQGIPTVFVRTVGCNLDCRYCDTQYARSGGETLSVHTICDTVDSLGLGYVCITGGEPMLQADVCELSEECLNRGYVVSVETNGSLDASRLPEKVIRVIDIKCPGSSEHGNIRISNILNRRPNDEFKFVLSDRADFEFACDFTVTHELTADNVVLFSPVAGMMDPKLLAKWIIEETSDIRLHLQMHKLIWPDESKGR